MLRCYAGSAAEGVKKTKKSAKSFFGLLGQAQMINLLFTSICVAFVILANVFLWVKLQTGTYSDSRHIVTSKIVVGIAIVGWFVVVGNAIIQTIHAWWNTRKLFQAPGTDQCDWERYDLCGITHKERLYRGEVWAGLVASIALMVGACYAADPSHLCMVYSDNCRKEFENLTDVWVPVAIGFQATALVPLLSIIDRLSLLTEEADRLLKLSKKDRQQMLKDSRVLSTDQTYTQMAGA